MNTKLTLPVVLLTAALGSVFHTAPVSADPEVIAAAQTYIENHAEWMQDPVIVSAINAQNAAHASMDQAGIDAMDQQWRSESVNGSGPMVDKVMANELSVFLQGIREDSQGLITEVFVMDNLGLNVGQSDLTSDFWQGDEAKWQKTYKVGANALFVDDVELDESSQRYQAQVNYSITDPATGDVIGAITIGIDAEGLLML